MGDLKINRPNLPSVSSHGTAKTRKKSTRGIDAIVKKYKPHPQKTCRLIGLFDATGSMAAIWSETRKHLSEMIRRIAQMGALELKWVAYRDYGDGYGLIEPSSWEHEPDPLLKFIASINCYGGDDWEEAVERALEVAADDPQATRVLLIGDAPPHPDRDYREQARRLGTLKRPVFSFVVGGDQETYRVFSEIAQLSGGTCCHLNRVEDLLDVVVITAAHDIGGEKLVRQYTEKYHRQLSQSGKTLATKLIT